MSELSKQDVAPDNTIIESIILQTSVSTIEDKLTQAENEISQLRSNLHQYEKLVDEYRSQVCFNDYFKIHTYITYLYSK